jgi:hypothetical protein
VLLPTWRCWRAGLPKLYVYMLKQRSKMLAGGAARPKAKAA